MKINERIEELKKSIVSMKCKVDLKTDNIDAYMKDFENKISPNVDQIELQI